MSIETGIPAITVEISRELLQDLGDWSEPVQVKVVETPGSGTGWSMIARSVEPKRAEA